MVPRKPKKPCKAPGCPNLTDGKYCEDHQLNQRQERASSAERGYDGRWRKARLKYLKAYPLCVRCKEQGRLVRATVVDHVTPHRGDKVLFWDENNWQSLCKSCHDKKTMKEDKPQQYQYFVDSRQGGGSQISTSLCTFDRCPPSRTFSQN